MSSVIREDLDALNTTLTITLKREDLKPEIDSELKKLKSKANMKGFRKGKTPTAYLRKVYGPSIMSDVVQKALNKELYDFLDAEKIKYLGQPIPSSDQEEVDLNIGSDKDLIFKFDLGLTPEIEVKGLDQNTYDRYVVDLGDAFAKEEIDSLRKRVGERKEVDDPITEGDLISLNATEQKDGGDGWASTFSILYDALTDDAKKIFDGKKKGDKVNFDITQLEKKQTPEYIRKYMLNVTEADEGVVIGDLFSADIDKVQRIEAAEMNEDFFNKAFGEGKVKSEQEAIDFIKNQTNTWYIKQADSILMREIHDELMKSNEFELPEAFLQRWLESTSQPKENMSPEERFSGFKEGLKWRLISSKLADEYEVKVSEEEVKETMKEQIARMYGGYGGDDMMDKLVESMMGNREYYENNYVTTFNEKVLQAAKDKVATKEVKVDKEAFEEILKKYSEQNAASNTTNGSEEE